MDGKWLNCLDILFIFQSEKSWFLSTRLFMHVMRKDENKFYNFYVDIAPHNNNVKWVKSQQQRLRRHFNDYCYCNGSYNKNEIGERWKAASKIVSPMTWREWEIKIVVEIIFIVCFYKFYSQTTPTPTHNWKEVLKGLLKS